MYTICNNFFTKVVQLLGCYRIILTVVAARNGLGGINGALGWVGVRGSVVWQEAVCWSLSVWEESVSVGGVCQCGRSLSVWEEA